MRILVIEDEAKIGRLLKKGLMLESFAVDLCTNAADGLYMATHETYNVLVLDRRLPDGDGLQLCHELRNKSIHTPILMLTARDLRQDILDGLNGGADDYVVKPFDFDELVARIRALARRSSTAHPVVLSFDELELDTTAQEARRQGKSIVLTAKELAVLELFLRHPNQILSKQTIIDNVWDYDSIVVSNNVEVLVRLLRNKIDRPFEYPLIHTYKNLGYKLARRK